MIKFFGSFYLLTFQKKVIVSTTSCAAVLLPAVACIVRCRCNYKRAHNTVTANDDVATACCLHSLQTHPSRTQKLHHSLTDPQHVCSTVCTYTSVVHFLVSARRPDGSTSRALARWKARRSTFCLVQYWQLQFLHFLGVVLCQE